MSRHLDPTPPSGDQRRLDIAIAGVLGFAVLSATCGVANAAAPHAQPVTVAAPTAVDLRESTGHGGPIGPLAGPSFAPDVPVWTEDKGAVIVDGQALPTSTVVLEPVVREAAPEPTPPAVTPSVAAASAPTATPTPVVEPTDEPVQTTPTETTEPTDPTVTVGLPEITVGALP